VKPGDLVKFDWKNTPAGTGPDEMGVCLKVIQPKGLEKPIAKVLWFSMNHPLQHLTEVLEVISENR
jgi:hypothetical protein